jgi:hypothetical protein
MEYVPIASLMIFSMSCEEIAPDLQMRCPAVVLFPLDTCPITTTLIRGFSLLEDIFTQSIFRAVDMIVGCVRNE